MLLQMDNTSDQQVKKCQQKNSPFGFHFKSNNTIIYTVKRQGKDFQLRLSRHTKVKEEL